MVRSSGILLHITSLPSNFGIGDLGPESYRFVELLSKEKQRYWSILPLSPTRLEDGNSPYQSSSAFAGNPLLISPEKLVENGFLSRDFLNKTVKLTSKVNFKLAYVQKELLLKEAYNNFKKSGTQAVDSYFTFEDFCQNNQIWLNDYALYTALRNKTNSPWHLWPSPLRKREPLAISKKESAFQDEIKQEKFKQYIFFGQLFSLKKFCKIKQVYLIGDMPFYVTYDSADVWVHPELFRLDSQWKPEFVGGVPPDYFSATGQLWGNPVYNWEKIQQTGFEWWIDRVSHNLKLYDRLRLDHFRGFVAYWEVPAFAKTAQIGKWAKTPSESFFKTLMDNFPSLSFIAEDLGDIDEPVREVIKRLGIPGMRVLLFAFGDDLINPHLPKNHIRNCVAYTATHDTNTVKGWFTRESSSEEQKNLFKLVGRKVSAKQVSFEVIKLALASVADLSIVPLQDILGLGSSARMNNPGVSVGNWEWRATPKQLTSELLNKFGAATTDYERAN